jgi:hypothetical protein
VGTRLQVLTALMEEDVTAQCGALRVFRDTTSRRLSPLLTDHAAGAVPVAFRPDRHTLATASLYRPVG